MITDYKSLKLFEKELFVKVEGESPMNGSYPMPNEACFFHLMKGRINAISEESLLELGNDHSVLMKCGNYVVHFLEDQEDEKFEAIMIHFHPEVLLKIYDNDIPSFLKQEKELSSPNMVMVEASILVNKYIEDLIYYFKHPKLVNQDILILKMKEIILLLIQTKEAESMIRVLKNLFTKKTLGFKQVIEAHVFSNISIKELADLTNLSLSSFKRQFTQYYNTTPAKYFRDIKLEKAKDLLAISDKSISEICFESGFNTLNHFSTTFKEMYGFSPSEYRLNLLDK